MVRIKKSRALSARTIASLGAYAKEEWRVLYPVRRWFYLSTRRLWTLSIDNEPVCVIGLKQTTMIGTGAELYFMLCRGLSKHAKEISKFIRRGIRRLLKIYGMLFVRVAEDFWIGEKFVKFFGFQCKGVATALNGSTYKFYELRTAWLQH